MKNLSLTRLAPFILLAVIAIVAILFHPYQILMMVNLMQLMLPGF